MLVFGINGNIFLAIGQDAGQLLEGRAGNYKLEAVITEGFDLFFSDSQAVAVYRDEAEGLALDLEKRTGVDWLVSPIMLRSRPL